jgi:glycosyltransferase involved in cell wall biosynthesis
MIFFRLILLMRKLRPDVVQTILTPMDIMGGTAAMLTRTPWVLKESSSAALYTSGLRYRWRQALARRAHGIVSNSAGGAVYWRSVGVERPLCVVPNGVPVDEIEKASGSIRNDLQFSENTRVLLFAGRLDAGKNVENLIHALSRISDQLDFVAFICGDGRRRARLERLAREFGLAQRVIFTGYVSNLWTLMKRADLVISLSRFEGRPNVVLEAMGCGCPLVVSDIPAHREVLDDSTASFVDPEDPRQVARVIEEVLVRSGITQARARAAQDKVAQWSIAATARQYEQVYLRLLSGAADLRNFPIIPTAECARANES